MNTGNLQKAQNNEAWLLGSLVVVTRVGEQLEAAAHLENQEFNRPHRCTLI